MPKPLAGFNLGLRNSAGNWVRSSLTSTSKERLKEKRAVTAPGSGPGGSLAKAISMWLPGL